MKNTMGFLLNKIKLELFKRNWRKQNIHNNTFAVNRFSISNVSIGKMTYGGIKVFNDSKTAKLKIGSYCSIAQEVTFILGLDHNIKTISTFPFSTYVIGNKDHEAFSKGNILVDDDVWIGYRATILSGVHINQGAVIAAGAVVTDDVPPYAIVGGVPARVIKYRFEKEMIEELLMINYDKLTKELVVDHEKVLYEDFAELSQLAWFPKRDLD